MDVDQPMDAAPQQAKPKKKKRPFLKLNIADENKSSKPVPGGLSEETKASEGK